MGGKNSGRKPKQGKIEGTPVVAAKVEDKPKTHPYGCGNCHKEFDEKFPYCPYCMATLNWGA